MESSLRCIRVLVAVALMVPLTAQGQAARSAPPRQSDSVAVNLRREVDSLRRVVDSLKARDSAPTKPMAAPGASTSAPSAMDTIPDAPPPGSHSGAIELKYDRFKGASALTLRGLKLKGTMMLSDIDVSALMVATGEDISRATTGSFIFSIQNAEWRFLQCHTVRLLADGKPVAVLSDSHDGTVGRGYVLEHITTMIGRASLLQLARANVVEGQICNTEFALSGANQLAIRDFVSRLKTQRP